MLPSSFRALLGRFTPAGMATRWVRVTLVTALCAYFLGGASLLALRYAVLPRVTDWRPEIERELGRNLGLPVRIDALAADWDGLRPRLDLRGLQLQDSAGRPALRLERVEASVAWVSLVRGRLILARLVIHTPELAIRREADGRLFVAGLALGDAGGGSSVTDWLLDQREIVVSDASVVWTDARRRAPPLRMAHARLRIENGWRSHRFGLTAEPPRELAAQVDVRGEFADVRGRPMSRWTGRLYAMLGYAELARWTPWIDYPVDLSRGQGAVRVWLALQQGRLHTLESQLALRDVRVRFAPRLPALDLATLSGRVAVSSQGDTWRVQAEDLALSTGGGLDLEAARFALRRTAQPGKLPRGDFSASRLDLAVLAGLAAHLPFPTLWRERLATVAPEGRVDRLELGWTGEEGVPEDWRIDARFADLAARPHGQWPGGRGWSGRLRADPREGRFELAVARGGLALPEVFEVQELALDEGRFEGRWAVKDKRATVTLDTARFRNADLEGSLSGRYSTSGSDAGHIDLQGGLAWAEASAVWRYLPTAVSADARAWLARGLPSGRAEDARLRLRGPLDRFPFADGSGEFLVEARARDVRIDYADGWPMIDRVQGTLRFEGAGMTVQAEQGEIFGTRIGRTRAVIADLEHAVLTVEGEVRGPTQEFLRFVNNSPVARTVGPFTRDIRAQGDGVLRLGLIVPLDDADKTTTRGEYQFLRNTLSLRPELPDAMNVNGRLGFTESSLSIPQADGLFLGAPARVTGLTRADGTVQIDVQGSLPVRNLAAFHDSPLWDHLSGETPASARVLIRGDEVSLAFDSTLLGVSASLPEPFNKSAGTARPLHVGWHWSGQGRDAVERVEAELAGSGRLRLERRGGNEAPRTTRAVLALGRAEPRLPERGLALRGELPTLDLDAWERALAGGSDPERSAPPVDEFDLQVGELVVHRLRFADQGVQGERRGAQWQFVLDGPGAAGQARWDPRGAGRWEARLSRLLLVPAHPGRAGAAGAADTALRARNLPALDLGIARFAHGGRELGKLAVRGEPLGDDWVLSGLELENPDGRVELIGRYSGGDGQGVTRTRFSLEAEDAGGLLTRLGYPGTLRSGSGRLHGALEWAASPLDFDVSTLAGVVQLDAESGQFSKIEPGVGRLLGVLSLQALPRRITLDFRDVFSGGFAFDSISGSMKINRGILRTDDLRIVGPAAKVAMSGTIGLKDETQHLNVTVQPTLSETVALGAAVAPAIGAVNPVVGVVAYVTQKVLQDPIEQLFTYQYMVVGTWSDPQVRKLDGAKAPAKDSP